MADTTVPAPTAAPDVDPDTHHVQLDLMPAAPQVLTLLARAIVHDHALAYEFKVLAHNHNSAARLELATRTLLDNPVVQYALRPSITPKAAEDLADELLQASREPEACSRCGDGFADPFRDDGLCASCGALDEDAAELHSVRRTA